MYRSKIEILLLFSLALRKIFLAARGAKFYATLGFILLFLLLNGCRRADQLTDQEKELERLKTLPYVSFSDRPSDRRKGVIVHNRAKSCPGYNLYSSRTSFEAFLIDSEGQEVHRWGYHEKADEDLEKKWENVILLKNGDLVVLHKFVKIFRLDWNSKLLWKKDLSVHHDLDQKDDHSFYVVGLENKRYNDLLMRFPTLLQLDAQGVLLKKWSSLDQLEQMKEVFDTKAFMPGLREDPSKIKTLSRKIIRKISGFFGQREKPGRPFHSNTVKILPDTLVGQIDQRFRQGNLLVCFRNISQIGVFDPEKEKFVWAWGSGELEQPHHPTMLESGNILIFDNGVRRKYSRIIELNPLSGRIEWEYKAKPPENFYSVTGGSVQRLWNGNTLITETRKGRVFEITKDGEIVWEWLVPIFDQQGHRGTIYRMIRHPEEELDSLLR